MRPRLLWHVERFSQGYGRLHRIILGEVDNVDGGAVLFDEALDDGVKVVNKVLKLQGNRADRIRDKGCVTPGAFLQLRRDFRGVAQGG